MNADFVIGLVVSLGGGAYFFDHLFFKPVRLKKRLSAKLQVSDVERRHGLNPGQLEVVVLHSGKNANGFDVYYLEIDFLPGRKTVGKIELNDDSIKDAREKLQSLVETYVQSIK